MATKFRFSSLLFRQAVSALAVQRRDLALTLLRAMHAQLTMASSGIDDAYERHLAHQRLAERINKRLAALGHGIILGVFPRGASTEVSLATEFGEGLVIGLGPKELCDEGARVARDARSWEDPRGEHVSTWFFFAGDQDAGLPAGVYFRRLSMTGRHDYLFWEGDRLQFFPPELCPPPAVVDQSQSHPRLTKAFLEAYRADLAGEKRDPWEELGEVVDERQLLDCSPEEQEEVRRVRAHVDPEVFERALIVYGGWQVQQVCLKLSRQEPPEGYADSDHEFQDALSRKGRFGFPGGVLPLLREALPSDE